MNGRRVPKAISDAALRFVLPLSSEPGGRWFKYIRPDHFNPVEGPPLGVCDFKQQLADILALE